MRQVATADDGTAYEVAECSNGPVVLFSLWIDGNLKTTAQPASTCRKIAWEHAHIGQAAGLNWVTD